MGSVFEEPLPPPYGEYASLEEKAAMQAMNTTILNAKRARKVAEEDALRLYNRVRQLHKEEEKALKRIQDTKKKAKEIARLRERNERKYEEKEQRFKESQEEVERQRQENLKLKEENLKAKLETETKIYTERISIAQQTKEERLEIERQVEESKVLARQKAHEQKEAVRKAQIEAEVKAHMLRTQKFHMAQEEYERRLREEVDERFRKEKEIEKLAKMEMELIERLKGKQMEQRKAYQQLEAALTLGASSARRSSSRTGRTGTGRRHPGQASSKGSTTRQQGPAPSTAPAGEPADEEIARAFSQYDKEGTGDIPALDLEGLMQDLGQPLSSVQLGVAIAQLDTTSSGTITFGEFLLWWKG